MSAYALRRVYTKTMGSDILELDTLRNIHMYSNMNSVSKNYTQRWGSYIFLRGVNRDNDVCQISTSWFKILKQRSYYPNLSFFAINHKLEPFGIVHDANFNYWIYSDIYKLDKQIEYISQNS